MQDDSPVLTAMQAAMQQAQADLADRGDSDEAPADVDNVVDDVMAEEASLGEEASVAEGALGAVEADDAEVVAEAPAEDEQEA